MCSYTRVGVLLCEGRVKIKLPQPPYQYRWLLSPAAFIQMKMLVGVVLTFVSRRKLRQMISQAILLAYKDQTLWMVFIVLQLAPEEQMRPQILYLLLGVPKITIRIHSLRGYYQRDNLVVLVILLFTTPRLEVNASTQKVQMELQSQRVVLRGLKVVVASVLTPCLCLLHHSHLSCITMPKFYQYHVLKDNGRRENLLAGVP